jgi:hypothetical protein
MVRVMDKASHPPPTRRASATLRVKMRMMLRMSGNIGKIAV